MNGLFSDVKYVFTSPAHIKEWAHNVGAEYPDREWLLSDYDSWERNPHYRGVPGRHPEDDYGDEA